MKAAWWRQDLYDGPMFTWDALYTCNYRCSYCWFEQESLWDYLAKQYPVIPAEKWLAAWERVHARYGRCRVDVLGGEPFVFPGAVDFYVALARLHMVWINTNLSVSRRNLEKLVAEADPATLHIHGSLHPEFADSEEFFQKALYLRDHGFTPTICAVSYPPLLERLQESERRFRAEGIAFTTLVFRGTYEGKPYPESFTPEQKAVLRLDGGLAAEDGAKWTYQVDREKTFGKICYAGHHYGNVKPNGNVYRCGMAGPHAGDLGYVGNLFEETFALWDSPKPCPVQKCSCQEYIFLADVQKNLRPDFIERKAMSGGRP